jgi:hypothetical protein
MQDKNTQRHDLRRRRRSTQQLRHKGGRVGKPTGKNAMSGNTSLPRNRKNGERRKRTLTSAQVSSRQALVLDKERNPALPHSLTYMCSPGRATAILPSRPPPLQSLRREGGGAAAKVRFASSKSTKVLLGACTKPHPCYMWQCVCIQLR